MPWQERKTMSLRGEFVSLARQADEMNFSALCRRFGISRPTGYKWLERYEQYGDEGLQDRSRRPCKTPRNQVSQAVQDKVLRIRAERRWGARKIRDWMLRNNWKHVPSVSTVHAILQRHQVDPLVMRPFATVQRFEADAANDRWQMDFKGAMQLRNGSCEPHTVIDDHSRFCLTIKISNKQTATVQNTLTALFQHYGMPASILTDNGQPWGGRNQFRGRYWTRLEVWLMSLGIHVTHSRIYHPQTCGKNERFHRTLKQELGPSCRTVALANAQAHFNKWRISYNTDRPHEALGMAVPADRYRNSDRTFPTTIAPPEYRSDDLVVRAVDKGIVNVSGIHVALGQAFAGQAVAARFNQDNRMIKLYFYNQKIMTVDQKTGAKV